MKSISTVSKRYQPVVFTVLLILMVWGVAKCLRTFFRQLFLHEKGVLRSNFF